MAKNIFVLGLDELNHAVLRRGAADEDELPAKYERCLAMLTWDIEPVANPEDLDTMG